MRRTHLTAVLLALFALACATAPSAPRDAEEQIASRWFDEISLRYDAVQSDVRAARQAGRMTAAQWNDEWTPLQFGVSAAASALAADLATWRTGGTKPATYEARRAELDAAVTRADAYAKGVRP